MNNRPPDSAHRLWGFPPEKADWGVAVVSADGMTLEMMNRAFASMHGYTVDELSKNPVSEVLAPDDRPRLAEKIRIARETGHHLFESRHLHRDGTVFSVFVDLTAVNDNKGHLIFRAADLRDFYRQRPYHQPRILITAIEQAAEGVVITDKLGTIEYVNPAFEIMTGFTRREAIGQNPRIVKSGEHNEAFYRALYDSITSGGVWHGHFINRKKDGTLYEEEAIISGVADDAGEILNYVAVKRDVTHEVNLERQLRQAKKLESIGRLAGGVAHDFNNILSVIIGNCDLSLMSHPKRDALRQNLEEIRKAGKRAADLARQLLAFSRMQALRQEVLDLNAIVKDAERMLHRIIGEHIELRTKLQPSPAPIQADPGQIEQVIVNLAVNARDAMPQGGMLTIETAHEALSEESPPLAGGETGQRDFVVLSVSDTGIGIKAEDKGRIFDPFFTTKTPGTGTGLGLATVYGIVQQCSGRIQVESEPGKGTTFKIYLPTCIDHPVPRRPMEAEESNVEGSETVLVVEDDEVVRALACKILKRYGYNVLDSRGAEDALALSERHEGPIGLILSDVVMPGMTAGEMAERIQKTRKETRVLFMSGYAGTDIARYDGTLKPGIPLMEKPFTPAELARKVREVLDGPMLGRPPA